MPYVQYPSLGAFSLSRALTPPAWLRKLVAQKVGAVIRGAQVQIPTSGGTLTYDLTDPNALNQLKAMVTGTRIVGPTIERQPASPVASIPGGYGTLALLGLGLAVLAFRGGGARRQARR